jgi:hypothetical protein
VSLLPREESRESGVTAAESVERVVLLLPQVFAAEQRA